MTLKKATVTKSNDRIAIPRNCDIGKLAVCLECILTYISALSMATDCLNVVNLSIPFFRSLVPIPKGHEWIQQLPTASDYESNLS